MAPSPCGAGGEVVAHCRSRRGLAPSPCGAGGLAPPLPLRRGGQAPWSPMASVRQWPHRRAWGQPHDVNVTLASTRSEHGTPGPRRRQARSPAAAVLITPGCHPDERLSSRPRGAGWNEAVRGPGVPRTAKGAVELRTAPRTAEGAVALRTAPRAAEGAVALRTAPRAAEGAVALRTAPRTAKGAAERPREIRDRRSWHQFPTPPPARLCSPS